MQRGKNHFTLPETSTLGPPLQVDNRHSSKLKSAYAASCTGGLPAPSVLWLQWVNEMDLPSLQLPSDCGVSVTEA